MTSSRRRIRTLELLLSKEDGQKFTQEGVLKVPKGFDPSTCIRFRKAKISYFKATLEDFNRVLQKARIKVFFRGFPLGTPTEEIRKFFSHFGRVEYLYLMASSKSGVVQTFIQGYFIYSSNEEAEYFLSQKKVHVFRGSRICCQVYIGNKKKKETKKTSCPIQKDLHSKIPPQLPIHPHYLTLLQRVKRGLVA